MADLIDVILAAGSVFDVISPVLREVQGYKYLYIKSRDYQRCVSAQIALERKGILARVGGDPISGYGVFTKERVR